MNFKKILVTGGAGFIGSNLVDQLLIKGHQVAVIDDLSGGKKSNLNPKAQFINLDIANKPKLSLGVDKFKPDLVFHLAAKVQVTSNNNDLLNQVNVMGTQNLISCLSGKPIIFASSVAVYGNSLSQPIKESNALEPFSVYGQSKLAGEKFIKASGLPYTIFRFANVYGPRQTHTAEGGAVAIFFNQALDNQPITIFGDGNQTRDFIYVDDIVSGLIKTIDKAQNQTFNLSNRKAATVNDLAKFIIKLTNSKSKLIYQPTREGEILHSLIDNSKAIDQLSFKPEFSLPQGLKHYYDFLKKN